ncbi:glycoside hydrolase family 9 protein [Halomicrobium salinisoli]|uniref:glycoside hydrolase family 9 protein n=1 Tax=Halomicrobium salinisoli TaxID=2878391 RepID=UPI001CF07A55|nr:glycoside hydrolase family 9 protein [Halomicrobium salinisoli]
MTREATDRSQTGESETNDGGSTHRTERRSFLKAGLVGLGTVAAGGPGAGVASAVAKDDYNLAHALQQSLYFFDANECGDGVTGQPLEWRGDCHLVDESVPLRQSIDEGGSNVPESYVDEHSDVLDPNGDGTVDLSGGFHDAGDHVKFGLPQAYAASTLGWALYEFEDAFREIGSDDHIRRHLRRFTDYFLKSIFRDDDGTVVAFSYQVANGNFDHEYWGPPELQDNEEMPRPAYLATPETPASDQCGAAAAALALQSLNLEDEDPEYAERCLDNAQALYEFGVEHRGLGHGGEFYPSSSDADDLAWAAVWLHVATGEQRYLEDVIGTDGSGNYTGHVGEIIATTEDEWNNTWVHSWDTVWSGVILKLAGITDDQQWWDLARWHLEYWTGGEVSHDGSSGNYIQTTPAGFSYLDQWGSARYNASAQFLATVYRKQGGEKGEALTDWARGQMQYIMGDNPFGYSLIVGFTEDHAEEPHHDAAHGSLVGQPSDPPKPKHTLWGALVGGPDDQDEHNDETDDYIYNEVAIDYNAGFVGALAGLYTYYGDGDEPVEGFPPDEEPIDPYYVEAQVEGNSAETVEIKAFINNVAVHPPRFEDGLSFRYFFDASGIDDPEGLTVDVFYDQVGSQLGQPAEVVGPEPYDESEGVYYVEFDYSGTAIAGRYELTFALSDYTNASLDASTDWSFQDLGDGLTETEYMPVYVDGELAFGREPGGNAPDTTAPGAPSPVTVTSMGTTSLGLSWSAVTDDGSGLDQYVVAVDGTERTTVPAGTTSATVDDLDPDTDYEISVRAVDGAGNESEPATATATTDTEGGGDGPEPLDGTRPTDPDGDGVYEDLNGNGETDYSDVVRYFDEIDGEYFAENAEYFDFNGNGEADYSDLVALFQEV